MRELDKLLKEHEELRRDAAALAGLIGPQLAVGWSDHARVDLGRFESARELLRQHLLAHEAKEERFIARRLKVVGAGEIEAEVERAHETLNRLMGLLHSVATLCTEGRVHALRVICGRVTEELELHLRYEETVLFPLLAGVAAR